jgi:hypothetical protein
LSGRDLRAFFSEVDTGSHKKTLQNKETDCPVRFTAMLRETVIEETSQLEGGDRGFRDG